jgi:hypothetical protein
MEDEQMALWFLTGMFRQHSRCWTVTAQLPHYIVADDGDSETDNERSPNVQWIGDRIVGCQSNNHTACKGELWECERCHKIICWEEGSTNMPELCDDCWCEVNKDNDDDQGFIFWLNQ